MAGDIRFGDIGTIFRGTIVEDGAAIDVSGATTKKLRFRKPSGIVVEQTASFTTSGTDGKIQYATVALDLNEVGLWKWQGYVVLSSGTWHTDIHEFNVCKNL